MLSGPKKADGCRSRHRHQYAHAHVRHINCRGCKALPLLVVQGSKSRAAFKPAHFISAGGPAGSKPILNLLIENGQNRRKDQVQQNGTAGKGSKGRRIRFTDRCSKPGCRRVQACQHQGQLIAQSRYGSGIQLTFIHTPSRNENTNMPITITSVRRI